MDPSLDLSLDLSRADESLSDQDRSRDNDLSLSRDNDLSLDDSLSYEPVLSLLYGLGCLDKCTLSL